MERRRYSPLIYWAREREQLRKNKALGVIPWSDDEILLKYRFTNLRRRDDRVSQWLLGNVLNFRHLGFSEWSYLQFTALCRWINWPPTLQALRSYAFWPTRELDLPAIARFMDDSSGKVWTGAYMVRAPRTEHGSKARFICETVIGAGMDSVRTDLIRALARKQLRGVWEVLYSIENWGPFMAGQVVADWSYTPLLERAGDLCSWAPQGPGSVRGYNRLLGLPLRSHGPDEETWCSQLQSWREELIAALGPEYVTLTLMDVQNALCETDKYERVRCNEGRPRSIYRPEMAY